MDEKALRERIDAVYSRMRERAKPKKWKSGKRAGSVRKAGIIGLPFTRDRLWQLAVNTIGPTGVTQCPYCIDIGRPAFLIDLRNIVFDHYVPLRRGGSWEIENIRGCCEDCNRLKGEMSYPFFVALMATLERWNDPNDRNYIHACLRTHGVSTNLRGFTGKPKEKVPTVEPVPMLPLVDDSW